MTGLGVKIIKLNKKDVCYNSGLRVGDVIIKLNNIPCYSHNDAIKIIKNSYEKRQALDCDLLIKSIN
jgi:type II secretory pathway component PulC